jgi:Ni,Fe-hydrogenase III component G
MFEVDIINLFNKKLADKLVRCSISGERRISMEVNADDLKEGISTLVKAYQTRFITLTATDTGLDIELMYHFSVDSIVVTLCITIPKETSQVKTITDIVPAAELIEGEVSELFDISFEGHSRTKNLVLPDDWPAENKPLSRLLAGSLPPQARGEVANLLTSGCAQAILRYLTEMREKAGLSKLPSIACANEENLKEFQNLVKNTGFDKRAGFNWEKGKLRYR